MVNISLWASQVALVTKNLPANAGDAGSIPGSERSTGGGNGTPRQDSCLENPMDKGAYSPRGGKSHTCQSAEALKA